MNDQEQDAPEKLHLAEVTPLNTRPDRAQETIVKEVERLLECAKRGEIGEVLFIYTKVGEPGSISFSLTPDPPTARMVGTIELVKSIFAQRILQR